ncbi:hypothetical protein LV779_09110 [Streptomyces thinghirensis]|nr:hypothetical protein [Streptomyces thinghirensis]
MRDTKADTVHQVVVFVRPGLLLMELGIVHRPVRDGRRRRRAARTRC